jgi:hypothetical protein
MFLQIVVTASITEFLASIITYCLSYMRGARLARARSMPMHRWAESVYRWTPAGTRLRALADDASLEIVRQAELCRKAFYCAAVMGIVMFFAADHLEGM